ncbi:hypothetical protein ACFX58_03595 [Sphingomonas sp. NCPPB 2930]
MGNGVDRSAEMLWLFLRNDGGWWTATAVAEHWQPTFTVEEIGERLEALRHGNFLARRPYGTKGALAYAVARGCSALPGRQLTAVVPARQPNVMSCQVYRPAPGPAMRAGALAANQLPSLQMGRLVYRSDVE